MVEGYNLEELASRILVLKHQITDYVLGDWEGEWLLYHKEQNKATLSIYKNRGIDLGVQG